MRLHRSHPRLILVGVLVIVVAVLFGMLALARDRSGYSVLAWNNLGMHCMDADFSVFAILPPYNVVAAQVVDAQGKLVTRSDGLAVTYEAVADPAGSYNSTSAHKTNFWQFAPKLFGANPAVDTGLAGASMPGLSNVPQPMKFDPQQRWWIADGIPITPYDDGFHRNSYPLMRVMVRDTAGVELSHTDVVLPVSDEMDCSACHASGSVDAARPAGGWIHAADPQLDYRENILLLHDDRQLGHDAFRQALVSAGYDPAGLWSTYRNGGSPILCAKCHASNALPGTGVAGVSQLTHAMHAGHSTVVDPLTQFTLGNSQNRAACYRCHPGATTRCLRGVMGRAVAADGSMAMQCQSCHGSMSQVGANTRPGWLDEPSCGNCHTGTATRNSGQIRFTSAYDSNGVRRTPLDATFATNPNVPAAGLSLYRFSYGHGGLACEACHGATHAEYVSLHTNDNLASIALQGHAGTVADCTACHASMPATVTGGPHGMHPIGDSWIQSHADVAEQGGQTQCTRCHGADLKGTVLSRALGNRSFRTKFGTKSFWQGFQISCYACHNGPTSEGTTKDQPATASDLNLTASRTTPTQITLVATDPNKDPLTYRIVGQAEHGTVGLSGAVATYFPAGDHPGNDSFTYAAWDGKIDSNLARVALTTTSSGCVLSCTATVPATASELSALTFDGAASATNCTAAPAFRWAFGDGGTATSARAAHTYAHSGQFSWTLDVAADGATCRQSGTVAVGGVPPQVTQVRSGKDPFTLRLTGKNFHSKIAVRIGTTPWANVVVKNAQTMAIKGSGLGKQFPRNTWVLVTLTNPDDGLETTFEYNRSLKQARGLH